LLVARYQHCLEIISGAPFLFVSQAAPIFILNGKPQLHTALLEVLSCLQILNSLKTLKPL